MKISIKHPKKRIFLSSIFCCFLFTAYAQIRLDIEGTARILGKLELFESPGDSSIHIGLNAGMNSSEFDFNNIFIGAKSGENNVHGDKSVFIGHRAGEMNTNGNGNIFIGFSSGAMNTLGFSNTFIGNEAGQYNQGSVNTFVGASAGRFNETGEDNVFIGTSAGSDNVSGSGNTYIGRDAGRFVSNLTRSTLIGQETGVLNSVTTDSLDRAIAIGFEAEVDCHSCAVIGGTGDNAVKVGISTAKPIYTLDVHHETGIPTPTNSPGNGINISNLNGPSLNWQLYVGGGVGKLRLYKDGSIRGTFDENSGNYIPGSDKRLKNNIQSLDNQLSIIKRLRPTTYQFNGRKSKRKVYGLIAQEVQKVLPDIVLVNEPDNPKMKSLGISYTELIPVLIAGVQEQQTILDQQQSGYKALKTEMETLKGIVKNLQNDQQANRLNNIKDLTLKQGFRLGQNQPNPFHRQTIINYFIPDKTQNAFIQVTALNGNVLEKTPLLQPGNGQVTIHTTDYPTGTYYYSLVVDGQEVDSKKMMLLR